MREIAEAFALALEIPVDAAIGPMLATVAGAIGGAYDVAPSPSWPEPLSLWSITVGESGSGKSPLISLVTGPLHTIEGERRKQHAEAAAAQAEAEARAAAQAEAEARAAAQAGAQTEADGGAKPPAKPKPKPKRKRNQPPPRPYRMICADTTPQALVSAICTTSEITVIADEADATIATLTSDGAKGGRIEAANLCTAYSGKRLIVDRILRGHEECDRPRLSMIWGAQPAVLRRVLAKPGFRESGFPARAMITTLTIPPGRNREIVDVESQRKRWTAIVCNIGRACFSAEASPAQPRTITLCDDAPKVFVRWRVFCEDLRQAGDADVWAKAECWALRIAGVLAVFEAVEQEVQIPTTIGAAMMERAVRLAAWFAGQTIRALATAETPDEDRRRAAVLAALRRTAEAAPTQRGVTPSELRVAIASSIRPPSAAMKPILEALRDDGLIVQAPTAKGDRARARWRLAPVDA